MNNVFITAFSSVSSLGVGTESSLNNLNSKKSFLKLPDENDIFDLPYFPISEDLNVNKNISRCSQLAIRLLLLIEEKWISLSPLPIFSATSTGGIKETEENYNDSTSKQKGYPVFKKHFFNSIFDDIKNVYKDKISEYYTFSTACSSSGHSLMHAYELIKKGVINKALVLGVDVLSLTTMIGFNSLKLISPTGTKPLTIERNGLTLGEGGGVLLLESNPKNEPIAEIIGAASTTDGHHISSPDPEGKQQKECILKALNEAGIKNTDIDYVNAHGTGTIVNDETEIKVIKSIFDKIIPVTSIKSYIGHTLGASALADIGITLGMLKNGIIYQPENMGTPIDEKYIPKSTLNAKVKYFLKNSFGFGGNNVSLIIKNYF